MTRVHSFSDFEQRRITDMLRQLDIDAVNPGACYGAGTWAGNERAGVFASRNPATGKTIADVIPAGGQACETVIRSACEAFRRWREIPAPQRGEVIRELGSALRRHKDALGTLVSLETGKIKSEGDGEVQEMIDMADFAVGLSRMLYGKTLPSERPRHRLYEQWHPLGPVAVITAFNFPVAVWAWNAFLAAVTGNSVIWRPSPHAPLCAIAVQKLCNRVLREAGHTGIFALMIEDGTALAQTLAADRRIALLSFTGSTAVGRELAQTVARRLGKYLLELSGNNAVIVDATADLDLAVPAIVFGSLGTAGQRCTSTRRLLVHERICDRLLPRLTAAVRDIVIGDPLRPGVLMGPLISSAAVSRFLEAVAEVKRQGGTILHGGKQIERPGWYVEPTLARAENHWDIVQRETFGPLLYVMSWRTLDEAIALHNAVPQGLSSAIFTRDLQHAERFLSAVGSDCGIANVNLGTSGAEIGGAFGGEKDTGGGREAGSDAWQAYMRLQTCTLNWGDDLPLAQGVRFGPGDQH